MSSRDKVGERDVYETQREQASDLSRDFRISAISENVGRGGPHGLQIPHWPHEAEERPRLSGTEACLTSVL